MNFTKSKIPDVIICEPIVHSDDRGYFVETFRLDKMENFIGHKLNFTQDNESKSPKNVLRGLHYQLPPFAQSKLVKVIKGSILDIAVDIRKGSPTFWEHTSIELDEYNKKQIFIPRGFAHGFVVLSEYAIFSYKVDNYYNKQCDRGIAFDDKNLGIDWVLDKDDLILSEKDKTQITLENSKDIFDYSVDYYA